MLRRSGMLLLLCGGTIVANFAVVRASPDEAEIAIKEVDLKGLDEFVAKHKGKPVVVDVWATWCLPCLKKLPKFISLAKKHKGEAEFVSLSIDDVEKTQDALKVLRAEKALFTNFRMKDETEAMEKKFGFEGVPKYLWFDANGKLAAKLDEVTDVEKKIAALHSDAKAAR